MSLSVINPHNNKGVENMNVNNHKEEAEVINEENQEVKTTKRKQCGFTLIEMMISVVVIGLLASIIFSMFSGGVTNKATALQKWDLTNRLVTVMTVASQAGGGTNVAGNPFIKNGGTLLDVLVGGEKCVADKFQRYYRTMGVRSFEESIEVKKAPVCTGATVSKGEYLMGNSTIAVAGTGGEMIVTFSAVTTDEVDAIVGEYGDGTTKFADIAKAGNSGQIKWTAPNNGIHNLTITRKLN